MKLTYKIPLLFIAIGFFTLTASFFISYSEIDQGLSEYRFQQLTASRESKSREIESYFKTINQQIITLSANLTTIEAAKKFNHAFNEIDIITPPQQQLSLQQFYRDEFYPRYQQSSQHPIDPLQLIPTNSAAQTLQYRYVVNKQNSDELSYHHHHEYFHPSLLQYQQRHNLYDLFLINPQGDVIYSVFKEIDFATNLLEGPHQNSGLARAFRQAIQLDQVDQATLIDYSPYIPSYQDPALFIASPIQRQGQLLGVLAFQLSIEHIDSVMNNNGNWREEGYGESGETYIVSNDYGMRNNSRLLIEKPEKYFAMLEENNFSSQEIENIRDHNTSILYQRVKTHATEQALRGISDTQIIQDYQGNEVLSSYAPLNIPGLNWVLLSEINKKEAFATLDRVRQHIINFAFFLFIVLVIIAIVVANRITSPLRDLVKLVHNIANKDFSQRIPVTKPDEIGDLSCAFNEMSSTLEVTTVSKGYIDKILRSMSEALFVLRSNSGNIAELRIQTINSATENILEMTPAEIIYRKLDDFMAGEFTLSENELGELKRHGSLPALDRVLISKSGKQISVLFSLSIMHNHNNALPESLVFVCIAKDITERKKMEEQLKLASTVFNNSIEPAIITDYLGTIIELNPAFEFALEYSKESLLGKNIDQQMVADNNNKLHSLIKKTSLDNDWRGEVTLKNKRGKTLPFLLSCSAVSNSQGEISHYVLLFSDISELKNKEQRILKIANYDALTGLPNRMLFYDRLEYSITHAQRNNETFALMFLDLDGFKAVNDTYGHQAGDELLIEVANRMKSELRESDTVARLGGDEFIVILNKIKSPEDYTLVANKLLKTVSQPYQLSMTTAHISTSIGISCYPSHFKEKTQLVEAADSAMYLAKKSGKNRFVVAQDH